MNDSLAKNAIFSFIKTFLSVAFPIITFAYASRILSVEGIGEITFSRSIITYFSMIALLGINYYGVREVARVRDDKTKLSCLCHELFFVNLIMTCFAYFLLFLSICLVSKFHDYTLLLWVNSITILLTTLGMDWLYQGLEKFGYSAKVSVLFQIIALIFMFIAVKTSSDVVNYTIVLLISSSGVNIVNFIYSRKFIYFRKIPCDYSIKKHIAPMLWLFAFAVSVQLYTILDSTMLGFIKGEYAVGIYTVAIKANKMTDVLITSLGVALIPRLAYYIEQKKTEDSEKLIQNAYNFVFMFSIPCAFGLFVLAPCVIELLSGAGFEDAIITMKILTPIVVIIPFNVLTNIQIFIPMKKEKEVIISSSTAALVNLICNLVLIPTFAENGAAVATVLAEGATSIICFIYLRRMIDISTIFKNYYQYWIAAIPILCIGIITNVFVGNIFIRVVIVVFLSGIVYISILSKFKNKYYEYAINRFMKKSSC